MERHFKVAEEHYEQAIIFNKREGSDDDLSSCHIEYGNLLHYYIYPDAKSKGVYPDALAKLMARAADQYLLFTTSRL